MTFTFSVYSQSSVSNNIRSCLIQMSPHMQTCVDLSLLGTHILQICSRRTFAVKCCDFDSYFSPVFHGLRVVTVNALSGEVASLQHIVGQGLGITLRWSNRVCVPVVFRPDMFWSVLPADPVLICNYLLRTRRCGGHQKTFNTGSADVQPSSHHVGTYIFTIEKQFPLKGLH